MENPCIACKGINEAVYTIVLDDAPDTLDLCRSCLRDAPTWAGWPHWTERERAQRERYLNQQQEKEVA